jgi:hypothetical protein
MESTLHNYPSKINTIVFWWINSSGLYFILGAFYVGFSSWFTSIKGNLISFSLFFVWGLLFIFFGNMFPEIITDERGLLVRFLFWRFRVDWKNVIAINKVSLFNITRSSRYVVKTKSLSPLHRFYGLYALSFTPSFLIGSDIQDFSVLIERIQERRYDILNNLAR